MEGAASTPRTSARVAGGRRWTPREGCSRPRPGRAACRTAAAGGARSCVPGHPTRHCSPTTPPVRTGAFGVTVMVVIPFLGSKPTLLGRIAIIQVLHARHQAVLAGWRDRRHAADHPPGGHLPRRIPVSQPKLLQPLGGGGVAAAGACRGRLNAVKAVFRSIVNRSILRVPTRC